MRLERYLNDSDVCLVENIELILLTEHQEWVEYCNWIDMFSLTLDEGLFQKITGALSKKIDFIKELAEKLGANFIEIAKVFKDSRVFKFFTRIGWSFSKLWSLLNVGFKKVHDVLDVVSQYIAKTGAAKWTEEKLKQLDDFLQKHPKTKRIAGIAVAGILAYIWFNMTFTGSFEYDFGMDDLITALAGKMTLHQIFAGKNGIKLLMLFASGLVGLSFPWPGPSKIQFIAGIFQTLIKRLKIKTKLGMTLQKIKH